MVARFIFGLAGLHRLPFPSQRQLVIRAAMDVGFRAFDVAPAYGNGLDEVELGLALKGRRHEVAINTKFGVPMPLYGARCRIGFPFLRAVDKYANPSYLKRYDRRCFSPTEMAESLQGSLKRMKTDYVDSFFLHEPLQPIPPALFDGIAAEAEKLKRDGVIRRFGTAGALPPVESILAHPALDVVQAPLAQIRNAPNLSGKTLIAYEAYQAFRKEGGEGGFKEYLFKLQKESPFLSFILATTRLKTLAGFKDLFE